MPFPEKETKENRKKKEKKKDCLFSLAEMGCQGFAGENYARRASFFEGQTAQPPDLDGPSETGYLCGLFVFG